MNNFNGLGRLTRDVDLRYSQSGTAVGNFTLAINRPFKNKDTNEYDADFINCVVFGKQAETLAQYVKRGNQVAIGGRVQTRTYENKEGKTVYVTEIVVENFTFVESARQQSGNTRQLQNQQESPFEQAGKQIDINDSDLPF